MIGELTRASLKGNPVDAGALGVSYFAEGFRRAYRLLNDITPRYHLSRVLER